MVDKNPRACRAAQHVTHSGHHLHIWCAKGRGHNGPHCTVAGVDFTDHNHDHNHDTRNTKEDQ